MTLCAAIDIGSNTTRLLVAEPVEGQLKKVMEQRAYTRIGKAVDAVVAAYEHANFPEALKTKNAFYEVLFQGSGSETLSSMLQTLHARIWRWRALGVTHPQRSPGRAAEAIRGLKAISEAIRRRDAAAAEQATRDEAMRGAAEVMRLLAQDAPARTARR